MPSKLKQSALGKQRPATARPAAGVPAVLKQLGAMARTVAGLQQELRETHFIMEVRLENLEVLMAEIQAELSRKKNGGAFARPSSHH